MHKLLMFLWLLWLHLEIRKKPPHLPKPSNEAWCRQKSHTDHWYYSKTAKRGKWFTNYLMCTRCLEAQEKVKKDIT